MRQSIKHIATLSFLLQGIGCVATQHEFEQTAIRRTVLHLYEEQVMDNLIRVYNLRPIIQMKYSGITGEIKTSAGGEFFGSQQDAAGVITNMFNYKAEASRENTLSVTANPILDGGSWEKQPARIVDGHEIATYEKKDSIYQQYLRFVWKPEVDAVKERLKKEKEEKEEDAKVDKPNDGAVPPQAQFLLPGLGDDLRTIRTFRKDRPPPKHIHGITPTPTVTTLAGVDEYRLTGQLLRSEYEPSSQPFTCKICKLRFPRAYHERKEYKGKYDDKAYWYWVPIEFGREYFRLAQSVTGGLGEAAQRGATSDGVLTELRLQRIRN